MRKKLFFLIPVAIVILGAAGWYGYTQWPSSSDEPVVPMGEKAPFFLTTMTHMESGFTDDQLESIFLNHVEELRFAMDLADRYDAKLTIESEEPFARANEVWNLNIMAEILERGHGVGTHCDVPPTPERHGPKNVQQLVREMQERKALVDALVGEENNYGCSGAGGTQDWVQGAVGAGFHYIDGIVGFHYLALPLAERPQGWTDEYILGNTFHYNAPYDIHDRIYPRFLSNTLDFKEDGDGTVLASAGDLGKLAGIAEGAEYCRDDASCVLKKDDVDALVDLLKDIDSWRDTDRVAKVSLYFPANEFTEENEEVFSYFFERMQELQEEGVITWATQREVYDACAARR
jgi:hypothetical protein